MASIPVDAAPISRSRASRSPRGLALPKRLVPAALLLPSLLFLAVFFALPALGLISYSVLTQAADGTIGLPLTLEHYWHFFATPLYARVLLTTLEISLIATAIAVVLGYPVALVMVRSSPLIRQAITIIVIAPLIVSVVVRTYGWQLILGNGPTGILNWLLLKTGITKSPVALLYSETAVVIGSLHVFFPMMVLPLASALGKIDPRLEDAARTLGATSWRTFRRIILPLSLPGLTVGCTLVFSLTAGSFVTPAILGGSSGQMLGVLVEQQILIVYNWPFGAACATVLVAIVLGANLVSVRVLERRRRTAMWFSTLLALAATVGALLLGVPAAFALVRCDFVGRGAVSSMLLSPLVFPVLITGVALLQLFAMLRFDNTPLNMLIGHVLVTAPYVVRTTAASLSLADITLEDAARTLGADSWRVFRRITVPQIAPGLAAGALFAFMISFDNFPISLWLADAQHNPVPLLIFQMIASVFEPSVAAISTLMILFAIAIVMILERVGGLRRAMAM